MSANVEESEAVKVCRETAEIDINWKFMVFIWFVGFNSYG